MRILKGVITAVAFVGSCSLAQAQDVDRLTRPSEADYADAAAEADAVIALIEGGEIERGVRSVFETSPFAARVKSQIPGLVGQAEALIDSYGNITACERAERSYVGSLVIRYRYLCQHESFASEWNFTVLKSASGWTISKINFSDID